MEFREDPAKARSIRSHSWHAQNYQSHKVKCCLNSNPLFGGSDHDGASERLMPAISQQVINFRGTSHPGRDASASSRVSKKAPSTREASAAKDPSQLKEKGSKIKTKMDLPKLPKVKNLHKRNKAVDASPKLERQKSFSFTKPSATFGKPTFLDVADVPAGVSRNNREERARSTNQRAQRPSYALKTSKTLTAINIDKIEDARHTSEQSRSKKETPAETARFRDKSFEREAKTNAKQSKKEPTRYSHAHAKTSKKPKTQINQDRLKVNMLESKIFQKEAMVKDWLQNSKLMKRAAIKNQQKAVNAEALKY